MNNLLKVRLVHAPTHMLLKLNFHKNIFRAQGGKANFWEWAALIGPLCELLQELNREFGNALGSKNGNRHAAPDLSTDIKVLMESLSKHEVYEVKPGRRLAEDEEPVVDCIAAGRSSLAWGNSTPLDDFNENLDKLQRRLKVRPLVGSSLLHPDSDSEDSDGTKFIICPRYCQN